MPTDLPAQATWTGESDEQLLARSLLVSILNESNEDIRSLKELLVYGIKGMAAYTEHANNLGYINKAIFAFIHRALTATTSKTIGMEEPVALNLECGQFGVEAMVLLDKANTESYGNPEVTKVNIGVRDKPAFLSPAVVKVLVEQFGVAGIESVDEDLKALVG